MTQGDVRLQIPAGSPAAPVAVPLVLGLAARAGLPVEKVDEVALAAEMLLGERAPADLRITLSVDGASLVVAIDGLPPDRVERRRHLLPTLVDGLEADGERVVIRAGS